jgi:pullulanase/glycogen debranching enzyme
LSSVNFVAVHDGFTLADVVSYDKKHNQANGEHNRDGHHANFSTNCGVEGPNTDPVVLAHRARLVRAMLACTLLAYDPQFELGATLAEASRPVALNHPHCAKFCVLGGAACSR